MATFVGVMWIKIHLFFFKYIVVFSYLELQYGKHKQHIASYGSSYGKKLHIHVAFDWLRDKSPTSGTLSFGTIHYLRGF